MSGETKAAISGWSTDTLKEHLDRRIDELEKRHDQKFTDLVMSGEKQVKGLSERFTVTQEAAKRAVDKAEAAQSAHNVAANEWRGTLNDFKATLVSKAEFDRVVNDFAAFKLETARLASQAQGERSRAKEGSDDNKSWIAIAISIATAVIMIVALLMTKV